MLKKMKINMKNLKCLIIFIIIFCLNSVLFADGYGTTSMNFLKIGISPSAQSLGEAYTAHKDDVSGLFYNPATMVDVKNYQAGFSYFQYFEDITNTFVGFSTPQYKIGGFGYSLVYLGVSNIDGRDIYDNSTGSLSSYSAMQMLNYNKKLGDFGVGCNVKYLQENLVEETATGIAYDFGVNYRLNRTFDFGASVENLGDAVKFRKEAFALPLIKRLGAGINFENATVYLDAIEDEVQVKFAVGVEYELMKILTLRCGFKSDQDLANSLRLGFGAKMNNFYLDYAFIDYGDFGYTHLLGLRVNIGKGKKTSVTKTEDDKDSKSQEVVDGNLVIKTEVPKVEEKLDFKKQVPEEIVVKKDIKIEIPKTREVRIEVPKVEEKIDLKKQMQDATIAKAEIKPEIPKTKELKLGILKTEEEIDLKKQTQEPNITKVEVKPEIPKTKETKIEVPKVEEKIELKQQTQEPNIAKVEVKSEISQTKETKIEMPKIEEKIDFKKQTQDANFTKGEKK
jgi:hypothetical protein